MAGLGTSEASPQSSAFSRVLLTSLARLQGTKILGHLLNANELNVCEHLLDSLSLVSRFIWISLNRLNSNGEPCALNHS